MTFAKVFIGIDQGKWESLTDTTFTSTLFLTFLQSQMLRYMDVYFKKGPKAKRQ
jgi:hypothetical protein